MNQYADLPLPYMDQTYLEQANPILQPVIWMFQCVRSIRLSHIEFCFCISNDLLLFHDKKENPDKRTIMIKAMALISKQSFGLSKYFMLFLGAIHRRRRGGLRRD